MREPEISIVMSLYNSAKYLREAVDSVLTQTFTNFEFIIIDDGSSDESADIVLSYDDSRISFMKQENKGLPSALNKAISVAKSDYIARMDPDDICLPERLEKQYYFLTKNMDVVIVGSSAILIDQDGKDVCQCSKPEYHEELLTSFPGSPFIHPSVMFRKNACFSAGMYPEFMIYGAEDAVLFGRMAMIGKLYNIQDALLKYRITPTAMSRKSPEFRSQLMEATRRLIANYREDIDDIIDALKKEVNSSVDARYFYHCDLARIYTWSGRSAHMARKHACDAIRIYQRGMQPYIILILSFFPPILIRKLYQTIKKEKLS